VAAYIRQRPANWFWLVGTGVTIWGVTGCAAWLAARIVLPDPVAAPGVPIALAAGAVLWGGIALLNKKLFARVLFTVAVLAAFAQIVWLIAAQDWLIGQGLIAAVTMLTAVLLVWFSEHSRRRGWIS